MPSKTDATTHVLTTPAVTWSIAMLHLSTCHSSFLLYLFLRRRMVETGVSDDIPMDLKDIRHLLVLPGGPAPKPLFRPLSPDRVKDVSSFWYSDHLAGSYGLSSLRRSSEWMVGPAGALKATKYVLPADHVQRARDSFLSGTPLSALALAAFLMRDYGFQLDRADGHPEDLVAAFRAFFMFLPEEHDADFASLFNVKTPDFITSWFDPAPHAAPCLVPGLMEALIPRKDESHGSTEEVPGGASGARNQDGRRSAA